MKTRVTFYEIQSRWERVHNLKSKGMSHQKIGSVEGLTKQGIAYILKSKSPKELNRDRTKRNYTSLRETVLQSLGGKCQNCGYDKDPRALQLDHIKGDGARDRRLRGTWGVYKRAVELMESGKDPTNTYQLLCANCNWIKKGDNNETRKL